jgi:hypothetical protein
MTWPALDRAVGAAADRGVRLVLAAQARDGLWRDFDLLVGASEAWTTSWVGWCLATSSRQEATIARQRAAVAIGPLSTPAGWGYNRSTEPDADSTAWAVRFLASLGAVDSFLVQQCLLGYVDISGRGHTFPFRATSWGDAHPDVTALIGLALAAAGAEPAAIARVRRAVLDGRTRDSAWRSFWWATDAYATAWSLAFLRESGGVPVDVAADVTTWLSTSPATGGAFDAAFRLLAATWLGLAKGEVALRLVDDLLAGLGIEGWEPEPVLFVPSPDPGATDFRGAPHADRGLMTAAICSASLVRWRAAAG